MSANAQLEQASSVSFVQQSGATSNVQLKSEMQTSENGDVTERSIEIIDANNDGAKRARNVRLEQRGPPFSRLEREAQMDLFLDEEEQTQAARAKTLRGLARMGSTALIVAGVVAITLAALFIWPAVVAWRQSNKLISHENTPSGERPRVGTARVMAILTAVLGALGTLVALGSLVVGMGALSLGVLLSLAMLAVGIVAARRLGAHSAGTKDESFRTDKAGQVSRASDILWITAMVLGLLIPGLASVALGSIIRSGVPAK